MSAMPVPAQPARVRPPPPAVLFEDNGFDPEGGVDVGSRLPYLPSQKNPASLLEIEPRVLNDGGRLDGLGGTPKPTVASDGSGVTAAPTVADEGPTGGRYAYPHTPEKTASLVSFLGSGAVSGVGVKLASILVSKFGDLTLEVLRGDRGDAELLSVPGIGSKKLASIRKSMRHLDSQPQQQQAHAFCRRLGFSDAVTKELWKLYGADLERQVFADPYMLIDEFPYAFNFPKVDALARTQLGVAANSIERATASLKGALNKGATSGGHCYQTRPLLLAQSQRMLYCAELPAPKALTLARNALDKMVRDGALYTESPPAEGLIAYNLTGAPPVANAGAKSSPAAATMLVFSQGLAREEVAVATAVRKRLPARQGNGESSGSAGEAASTTAAAGVRAASAVAHLPTVSVAAAEAAEALATAAAVPRTAETAAADSADGSRGALAALDVALAAEQAGAVLRCAEQSRCAAQGGANALGRMLILTGGPGTGKTFTVREVVRQWQQQGRRVMLACPTARAAAVLSAAVGLPACTLHRLLEYNPQERAFKKNQLEPLETDALVIDEASMLDVKLAARLFDALPDGCVLLVVGDEKQLPSVGPGAVLYDLLRATRVPRVALRTIHRQDPAGDIARNAALVSRGMPPVHFHRVTPAQLPTLRLTAEGVDGAAVDNPPEAAVRPTGCVLVRAATAAEAANVICDGALRWLESVGYDPRTELQVLSPQKAGDAGTHELNRRLKRRLNPAPEGEHGAAASRGARARPDDGGRLRVGDQVIQLINDYDKGVFNGDVGVVSTVAARAEGGFTVSFSGRGIDAEGPLQVAYPHSALERDLALSYALTVHKAQGSEYPVVVLPVINQHKMMLYRNLLYTGLSRAKRLLVLVGTEDAIQKAVENDSLLRRNTLLAERVDMDELAPPTVRHL